MPPSPPKADWMSFVLHFLFGLAIGAVIGGLTISRRHGIWLQEDFIFSYLCGTAFLGAGLGAKWGDRLWMASSSSIVGSDAPTHSRFSNWLCSLSTLIGLALVATSLFKNFYKP